MKSQFAPSELVIEIATPQNSKLVFHPLGATLRGRWSQATKGLDYDDDTPYRGLPTVIPGMHVALDIKARTLRAVDPLGFRENAQLLAQVQASSVQQGKVGPQPELRLERLNESEIKTALWRMWEAVDSNHAELVQGEFPPREKILGMAGRLMLRYGSLRNYDPDHSLDMPLPPWATDAELERMGAPPREPVKTV